MRQLLTGISVLWLLALGGTSAISKPTTELPPAPSAFQLKTTQPNNANKNSPVQTEKNAVRKQKEGRKAAKRK